MPGELVHVDIKKLGRFRRPGHRVTGRGGHHRVTQTTEAGRGRGAVGWDFVHVCVDDATRVAYVEVLATSAAPPPPPSSTVPSAGSLNAASRSSA